GWLALLAVGAGREQAGGTQESSSEASDKEFVLHAFAFRVLLPIFAMNRLAAAAAGHTPLAHRMARLGLGGIVFPSVHSSPRICLRGTLASLRTKSRVSPRIEGVQSENSSGIFPLPRFLGCFKRGPFLAETQDSWLRALDWAVHGSGRNRNAERTADDVKIEGAELVFISCLWLFWS